MAHCPKKKCKRNLFNELMEPFDPKHLKVGWHFKMTAQSPQTRMALSRLAAANVPYENHGSIACPCGGVGFWFESAQSLFGSSTIRRVLCPVHKEQAKLNLVGMVRVWPPVDR